MKTATIVGAGDMGHGIAEICSINGFKVNLYDIDENILQHAIEKIQKSLKILIRKKKIQRSADIEIINRIHLFNDLKAACIESNIVFEVVPESLQIKNKVLQDIEESVNNEAIIASNTSYISITQLGKSLRKPERFIGMHFFNPVVLMKSLEIIKGKNTSEDTILLAKEVGICLGKKYVIIPDSPGFVVNRIQLAPQVLLCQAVQQNIITPQQIDTVMKNLGMSMGAFEIMDYSGLDVVVKGMNYMANVLNQDYGAPSWIKEIVEQNHLGKKTGKGIYEWNCGKAIIDDTCTTDIITPLDLMFVQINEATKLIETKIIDDYRDIDLLIKNGTGNPMGIFSLLESLGKEKVIERCEFFAKSLNLDIFKPTKTLKDW